jgi:hypothetical protein
LLFDNAKRSATVKAAGLVKLLCLQKEAFDRYVLSHPQHKDKLMSVLGQRMDKNIKVRLFFLFSCFFISWVAVNCLTAGLDAVTVNTTHSASQCMSPLTQVVNVCVCVC